MSYIMGDLIDRRLYVLLWNFQVGHDSPWVIQWKLIEKYINKLANLVQNIVYVKCLRSIVPSFYIQVELR